MQSGIAALAPAAQALVSVPSEFVDNGRTMAIMRAFGGGVPEWLKGADCKSAGVRLRWFESNPLHHY